MRLSLQVGQFSTPFSRASLWHMWLVWSAIRDVVSPVQISQSLIPSIHLSLRPTKSLDVRLSSVLPQVGLSFRARPSSSLSATSTPPRPPPPSPPPPAPPAPWTAPPPPPPLWLLLHYYYHTLHTYILHTLHTRSPPPKTTLSSYVNNSVSSPLSSSSSPSLVLLTSRSAWSRSNRPLSLARNPWIPPSLGDTRSCPWFPIHNGLQLRLLGPLDFRSPALSTPHAPHTRGHTLHPGKTAIGQEEACRSTQTMASTRTRRARFGRKHAFRTTRFARAHLASSRIGQRGHLCAQCHALGGRFPQRRGRR